jgi:hypothetical protein
VGFEPTIPVFERAKTVHGLDRGHRNRMAKFNAFYACTTQLNAWRKYLHWINACSNLQWYSHLILELQSAVLTIRTNAEINDNYINVFYVQRKFSLPLLRCYHCSRREGLRFETSTSWMRVHCITAVPMAKVVIVWRQCCHFSYDSYETKLLLPPYDNSSVSISCVN